MKYPELKLLIPQRPVDALECPECEGSGGFGHLDPAVRDVICSCGGLGWVPKDLNES